MKNISMICAMCLCLFDVIIHSCMVKWKQIKRNYSNTYEYKIIIMNNGVIFIFIIDCTINSYKPYRLFCWIFFSIIHTHTHTHIYHVCVHKNAYRTKVKNSWPILIKMSSVNIRVPWIIIGYNSIHIIGDLFFLYNIQHLLTFRVCHFEDKI